MESSVILSPPSTPTRKRPSRNEQPVGTHFISPSPKQRRPKAKHKKPIIRLGQDARIKAALAEMHALEAMEGLDPMAIVALTATSTKDSSSSNDILMDVDFPSFSPEDDIPALCENVTEPQVRPSRRIVPDDAACKLFSTWDDILATLVPHFLHYSQAAHGMHQPLIPQEISRCSNESCEQKISSVQCLYWYSHTVVDIPYCNCRTLAEVLVRHGLFPTSPSQPRIAVSIDLLDFYFALFARSGDAVSAMAAALRTFYISHGFPIINYDGESVQDPFRRSLGRAIQWYDTLRRHIEDMVEEAISRSHACVTSILSLSPIAHASAQLPAHILLSPIIPANPASSAILAQVSSTPALVVTQINDDANAMHTCARVLQSRCPACFSGTSFGRSLLLGADIHVATDATFSQRHNRAAGDCPSFYKPEFFISKEQVDAVGRRIEAVRKRPRSTPRAPRVPDEAVMECQKSHEAADEKKEKTHSEKFDDTGLMALVCRHDIILFLANVDTPGEQQKYAFALIEHLFSLLPPNATVGVLYDIGCVVQQSIDLYEILPDSITERIRLAISAMHAYGHQWACQLMYNPRLIQGFGLTDGEGTERTWSHFRKLIPVTRTSARSRRIWKLDRHAKAISEGLRVDLGRWTRSRMKTGITVRKNKAIRELSQISHPLSLLREEWAAQQKAQLSIRAHAPARLKRELDAILNLHAHIDGLDSSIDMIKKSLKESISVEANSIDDPLASLERTHARLLSKVDALYSSLDIQERFPEVEGTSIEFMKLLFLARDLKINIRKRAIGSFFEWERLDQAAGGRDQALGTKLHQQTRKAIAKRTPALTRSIKKFNGYCDDLTKLHNASCPIPLPQKLPSELSILREDSSLLADVWIEPIGVSPPRWLNDPDVRRGIRCFLALDRCDEEHLRLQMEATNMIRWYEVELASLELALRTSEYKPIHFLIHHRRVMHLQLQSQWRTPFITDDQYAHSTFRATQIALQLVDNTDDQLYVAISSPVVCVMKDDDFITDSEDVIDADQFETAQTEIQDLLSELAIYDENELFENEPMLVLDAPDPSILRTGMSEPPVAGGPLPVDHDADISDQETYSYDLCLHSQPKSDQTTDSLEDIIGMPLRQNLHPSALSDIVISTTAYNRLANPTSMLCDECINGCARLLQLYFAPSGNNMCILSSHISLQSLSDDSLWRNTYRTRFWEYNIWIIPIHHQFEQHWTLGVVDISRCAIYLYDSFADHTTYESNSERISRLICRLFIIANTRGHLACMPHQSWDAFPILTHPQQHNGFDCGVWVLATISSTLRGCDVSSLTQLKIIEFREFLCCLVANNIVNY